MTHDPNKEFAPTVFPTLNARLHAGREAEGIPTLDLRYLCRPGFETTVYASFPSARVPFLRLRHATLIENTRRSGMWCLQAVMGPEEAGRGQPRNFEHDPVYVVTIDIAGVRVGQAFDDAITFHGVIPSSGLFGIILDDPRPGAPDCERCAQDGVFHANLGEILPIAVPIHELKERMRGVPVEVWFARYEAEDDDDE